MLQSICTHLAALLYADGLLVPLRVLDKYRIVHSSTADTADLVQAWSTPLLAEGDVNMTDVQGKSKQSNMISQCVIDGQAFLEQLVLPSGVLIPILNRLLKCRAEKTSPHCNWPNSGLEFYLWCRAKCLDLHRTCLVCGSAWKSTSLRIAMLCAGIHCSQIITSCTIRSHVMSQVQACKPIS